LAFGRWIRFRSSLFVVRLRVTSVSSRRPHSLLRGLSIIGGCPLHPSLFLRISSLSFIHRSLFLSVMPALRSSTRRFAPLRHLSISKSVLFPSLCVVAPSPTRSSTIRISLRRYLQSSVTSSLRGVVTSCWCGCSAVGDCFTFPF